MGAGAAPERDEGGLGQPHEMIVGGFKFWDGDAGGRDDAGDGVSGVRELLGWGEGDGGRFFTRGGCW